ncbi:unnamed protein product [Owenia fusiformis]|uniref:Sas10 C-terminal domain-containing protein n=1 Tax=Owenia fusiformis TaxID=6347 RepID=A0A8S4MWF7_OWEFU|nr:unnamed protein product [Owenia fusiformis]
MTPISYGSDDERAYENEKVPDKRSRDFMYDEIDEFHAERDKVLLDKGTELRGPAGSDQEEEFMPLADDDSDDDVIDKRLAATLERFQAQGRQDDMASDVEDEEQKFDDKAWGTTKNKYYGADVDEEDLDVSGSDVEAAAEMEEQEALAFQRKMADNLDDDDFGLEIFKVDETEKTEAGVEKQIVKKDLSKLSKKEKIQLLKKESPELLPLIEEFKSKLGEVTSTLQPLVTLIKNGNIPPGNGADFIMTKYTLYMNYCVNISFYMMLQAKKIPVHNHPVIKRLVQYRNLLKQLEPIDAQLAPKVERVLTKLSNGEEIRPRQSMEDTVKERVNRLMKRERKQSKTKLKGKVEKKLSELVSSSDEEIEDEIAAPTGGRTHGRKRKPGEVYETNDEKEALEYYNMMKSGKVPRGEDAILEESDVVGEDRMMEEEEDVEEDGKRGITRQIEKNRGLTPNRKKENKNPRVKNRIKYRKAKIRRKGQLREYKPEMEKYGGEISGIRAGLKRSVKLK